MKGSYYFLNTGYNTAMFRREKVLHKQSTDYGQYQVIDMTYEGRKARVLFTGNRDAAFSGIPLDDNHEMLFDYIQRMYEFTCNILPSSALIIGGGTHTLASALLQTLPNLSITSIEIDPTLTDLSRRYFNLYETNRHTIIHQDAESYLKGSDKIYDLVIIDAFSHLSIPTSLTTPQFTEQVKKHAKPSGMIVMNVISSLYGVQSTPVLRMRELFDEQFQTITVHQADVGTSLWQAQNLILVATNQAEDAITSNMRFRPL
jgi:spermidine synthase